MLVGGQAYREQYGLDTVYLLPANLYGPRDNFDLETSHVVPALVRKMLAGTPEVVLWGDGSPTRIDFFATPYGAFVSSGNPFQRSSSEKGVGVNFG